MCVARLLANLRKNDADKRYKVPKGGLFPLLCCPHYTCELVAWAGFAMVLNHAAAFCLLSFFVLYLLGRGRSYSKRSAVCLPLDLLPPHTSTPAHSNGLYCGSSYLTPADLPSGQHAVLDTKYIARGDVFANG